MTFVASVDQTEARSQPCELTANYDSELPAGIGHEVAKGPTSCLLPEPVRELGGVDSPKVAMNLDSP